jgi:short-subunit dehydrogenase
MNIIVNGGTKGIGKEIVLLLAKEKSNHILATGRNTTSLKQLASSAEHGNISTCPIDLALFDSMKKSFIKVINRRFKHIDILINIAGSLVCKDFMEFRNDNAREMMEVNFFGPASIIRCLQPMMKKGSHIINISSMGGFQGSSKYKGLSYYSASKAALSCLSECLAKEFSEKGIIVNCLALGSVQTEMFKKAFPGYNADVTAREMAEYIADFAINGRKFFNGKVIPVAVNNP